MGLVSAIGGPVVNLLTVHITQKLRYLTSYAEHVERMKNRMQFLEGRSADIERLNSHHPNMPAHVPVWLEDVKKIKEDVDNIPSNNIGCFSVKKKFLAGRNALRLTKVIEGLIRDGSDMISDDTIWREAEGCLGRVNSKRLPSTSGGNTQIVFKSRDKIFDDALKLLQQDDDDTARVIALCGMGGVGKTKLMYQLKKVAKNEKMFNCVVEAVIGYTPNLLDIQKVIAKYIGESLTETDETLMATYLSKRFEVFSERKEKILIILDDVWEKIKLEDIGLASPLPNGVKLLLTSRNENICRQIAADADSAIAVVRVDVLEEEEARDFFSRITGISAEHDHDLYQIGCAIVKKCGCLPLAIQLIAVPLKCNKRKSVWKRTLRRLKNNLDITAIFDPSYKNLELEDKAIFLLCGMFPEDSNIPIEDLTRYAWGLELLKEVSTMEDARRSIETSVSNLKNAYLIDGDSHHSDFVKLHHLVLAFVVNKVSDGGEDGCWIIHHEDNFSIWSGANDMRQPCKQISLACKGMSEFPSEFKFPDLRVLKLTQGDESVRFPQDFYVGMEKLQVIAFEKLEYPVVPTSFQCSTNLRTLCLHECSLMFDLNCIGNLSNLEVLSFANSGITILPSTFENLKKLRLLDVTGCYNLVIDDGVLKSLVKLEELYMRSHDKKACWFTDNNCSELAERSKNLCALEFEFFGNNAHMKNMSYEKLKRFKLSVGCYFSEVRDELGRNKVDAHSYQKSLKLITKKEELQKSKISELFMNTDALYLQVNDMNTLEDVDVESPHPPHPRRCSSFRILRLLVVSECTELKYLFTPSVAKNLSKLEYLDISRCPIMEGVIHTENDGSEAIEFSNLKYLRLAKLPNLLHFCNNVDVVELPRLMELQLGDLPKFTSIYSDSTISFVSSNISPTQSFLNAQDATPKLEKLVVSNMENLKEIWPPQFIISNLCLLRELSVEGCGSIEVLFNMDFYEIEQLSSGLRSIKVDGCNSLVKLFSCNPFPFFNNLQELTVRRCRSIQELFDIDSGRTGNIGEQVCTSSLRSIVVEECDSLVNLLPRNPMPLFNHLEELEVRRCGSIQVLFDIDSGCTGNIGEQVCTSSLRSIVVWGCDSLVNLFPRNPMPLFNHLEELRVTQCASIEVIFDIDMRCVGETDRVSSSRLRSIRLWRLGNLREVWRIRVIHTDNEGLDFMFSNLKYLRLAELPELLHFCNKVDAIALPRLRELQLEGLPKFTSIYPDCATYFVSSNISPTQFFLSKEDATPKLEKLFVKDCDSIEVLFNMDFGAIEQLRSGLRSIKVDGCNSLVKLFSCNPFPFFNNLQELDIRRCRSIRVLFEIDSGRAGRYEEQDATPKLEKLFVSDMENLKEIWPPQFSSSKLCLLRELMVEGCGSIEVLFNMDFCEIEQLSSGLRSIKVDGCNSLVKLFSCNPFPFFNNLQELTVRRCRSIQELFDIDSGRTGNIGEQVCTSSLRSIVVEECDSLVNLLPRNPMPLFNHLEELEVRRCGSIQVLFDIDSGCTGNIGEQVCTSSLRSIVVWGCDSLVNLFPRNPMPLFNHLEELRVTQCASIEVIFDIDMRCVGETDRVSSSRLTSIRLWGLGNLSEVWRITDAGNNLIHGFEAVERIEIRACERFTANAGMRVLERRCLLPSTLDTCIYGLSP